MKNKTQKIVGLGIVLLFAFITIFHPVAADTTPQYGRIEGTTSYVDGWGTYPLPFVRVSTGGFYDYSNIFGEFSIDNMPLGTYSVTASKWGYQSVTLQIELTESSPFVHIDFILEEAEGDGSSYIIKSIESQQSISTIYYQVYLQSKV